MSDESFKQDGSDAGLNEVAETIESIIAETDEDIRQTDIYIRALIEDREKILQTDPEASASLEQIDAYLHEAEETKTRLQRLKKRAIQGIGDARKLNDRIRAFLEHFEDGQVQ